MPTPSVVPARVNPVLCHSSERRASLSGEWAFRLDPDDRGLREEWYRNTELLGERISVPGSWQGQGFGGDAPEMVWDFRLRARTFRATYSGTGWYCRPFRVPEGWHEYRVFLLLGAVHPTATVWLNGVLLGENHAPFVPFGFDVTPFLRRGEENLVVVRVSEDDRIMGLAYSWQGNWSGIYRPVELVATGPSRFERFSIIPDGAGERMRIRARIGGEPTRGQLILRMSATCVGASTPAGEAEVPVPAGDRECELPVPSPRLWSPDAPNLYRVDAELVCRGQVLDAVSERTGFVRLSTSGKHFLVNGEPYYLRGSGEFLPFPETGSPDTDRERLRRKLATLRSYGYNYVRCQSYAPVPEYYDVADEVGLIVQAEMGVLGGWGSHTHEHVYAWPQPTPANREALNSQWGHVVERDVNRPSAIMYCMSNELGGATHFPRLAWRCYRDTKAIKPNAFVIWTDGGFNPDLPADFVNAEADLDEKTDKPLIQHEFRWWSSLPDVRLVSRYSGAMRAYAAELAVEAASRHGIAHTLPAAVQNSQRLQFIEAKGKMEAMRRNHPRLAGICHFNAMDTNPSPQGIIDEFFERKYADAATWRQTNGDAVVLSSLGFDDRLLGAGNVLRCEVSVSDFSHPPFASPSVEWRFVADGTVIGKGQLTFAHEPFCTHTAGHVEVRVPDIAKPDTAFLEARLVEGGRMATNRWDFWLFPSAAPSLGDAALYGDAEHTWLRTVEGVRTVPRGGALPAGAGVVLAEQLDGVLIEYMKRGGRVVLAASEGLVRPFSPKLGLNVGRYFFTPPANYPPYEDGHDGTIVADHALLGALPHEGFADLQFYRMIGESPPLDLEPLGLNDADPVIRVMHSYPVGRSLGYLVERRVGEGGIVISALELDQSWPEARYLLRSMCAHAASGRFAPAVELSEIAREAIVAGTAFD